MNMLMICYIQLLIQIFSHCASLFLDKIVTFAHDGSHNMMKQALSNDLNDLVRLGVKANMKVAREINVPPRINKSFELY